MSRRNIGIVAIVIGFVITSMGGFVLAASNLPLNTLVTRSVIVFAVVLPIFLVGIYLFVTSEPESSDASETELQLQMMDMIREQGRVSFEELTTGLNVNMVTVTHLVEDLDALDLFTGYIDWGNNIIYAVRPHELPDTNP